MRAASDVRGDRYKLTYEHYVRASAETPMQILDGAVYVTPAPLTDHQLAIGEIYAELRAWAQGRGGRAYLGPVDVRLGDHDIVQPDACALLPGRLSRDRNKYILGAPDLAVEVLSPSNARLDRGLKKDRYFASDLTELWLVDLTLRTVEIFLPEAPLTPRVTATKRDRSVTSPTWSDLVVEVGEVFPRRRAKKR